MSQASKLEALQKLLPEYPDHSEEDLKLIITQTLLNEIMNNNIDKVAEITKSIIAPDIINLQTNTGNTALILACIYKRTEIVKLLLVVEGIDVNLADKYGDTALLKVSLRKPTDIFHLLLAVEGIDVNHPDLYGATALLLAKRLGNYKVANALRAKGAKG